MTSLTERLSAVRQSQWETQLDVFRTLGNSAIDNAEQLFALNMKTSRATVEGVAGTFQQLLRVNDPRDLLALGSQAQGQWQHMFAYSRELLGIAMGARQGNWSTVPFMNAAPAALPAPAQLLAAPISHLAEQAAIAVADATTITSEMTAAATDSGVTIAQASIAASQPIAASAEKTIDDASSQSAPTELEEEKAGEAPSEIPPAVKESDDGAAAPTAAAATSPSIDEETSANVDALVDTLIAEETPPVRAKPLAEALNQIAPKPASAEHPIASTVPLEALEANGHVELPVVTPAEGAPPAQTSQGPQAERRRGSRKK